MRTARTLLSIAVLAAAFTAAVPRADAVAQPTAVAHVETTYVNLTTTPAFTVAIEIPVLLRIRAVDRNGQPHLELLTMSTVDSLDARIRRADKYLSQAGGILTPLIEPPNRGTPIMGYVDRLHFERALRAAALRALGYTYTLKYKRLT